MTHTQLPNRRPLGAAARQALAAAALVLLVTPLAHAAAPTAAELYQRASDRESTLRADGPATLADYRAVVTAFEAVVRAYPRSGYCDDALWRAAGVALAAYDRFGRTADRTRGLHLLDWLHTEYPTSAYQRHLNERRTAFSAPRPAPVNKSTPTASAPPVVASPKAAPPPAPRPPAPRAAAAATPPSAARSTSAVNAPETPAPRAPAPEAPATPTGGVPAAPSARPAPPVPTASTSAAAPGVVAPVCHDIARTGIPHGDRVTLSFSGQAVFTSATEQDPSRLVLTLAGSHLAPGAIAHLADLGGSFATSVRVVAPESAAPRVEIALAAGTRASVYPLYAPYRLVVDVESEDAGDMPPAAPPAPAAPALLHAGTPDAVPGVAAPPPPEAQPATPPSSSPSASGPVLSVATTASGPLVTVPAPAPPAKVDNAYTLSRQLGLRISRVVIDPGHGGHDPGAQANGIDEAELVLDVALRLEKLLKARGVDVVLTRRTDVFVPLEERTAIANRENADLFISIHANASPRPAARGVETYVLNFASNPDAEAVAARENATSERSMGALPQLVKDIALNDKLAESRALATMVQTSLMRKLGPASSGLRDLGVKQAPFVVLIGAQMPSILAEISFITNRTDARLLKTDAYRDRIAQSLFDGIMKYEGSLKKDTTLAAKDPGR